MYGMNVTWSINYRFLINIELICREARSNKGQTVNFVCCEVFVAVKKARQRYSGYLFDFKTSHHYIYLWALRSNTHYSDQLSLSSLYNDVYNSVNCWVLLFLCNIRNNLLQRSTTNGLYGLSHACRCIYIFMLRCGVVGCTHAFGSTNRGLAFRERLFFILKRINLQQAEISDLVSTDHDYCSPHSYSYNPGEGEWGAAY